MVGREWVEDVAGREGAAANEASSSMSASAPLESGRRGVVSPKRRWSWRARWGSRWDGPRGSEAVRVVPMRGFSLGAWREVKDEEESFRGSGRRGWVGSGFCS